MGQLLQINYLRIYLFVLFPILKNSVVPFKH
uniref:Uncharacterized protein n=1 Tax=Campylobacter phage vB_CJ12660_3PH123 TaxID=3236702 RepID=A0AB39C5J0_9VIRU